MMRVDLEVRDACIATQVAPSRTWSVAAVAAGAVAFGAVGLLFVTAGLGLFAVVLAGAAVLVVLLFGGATLDLTLLELLEFTV